ncbi:hypothetical protein AV530_009157 [Patagioenas fasciata monilis]|uniref:Uncharacterized protein n=1 Tax=Patagioenas fasciata monilis TaxID=372326 RepID=A0A1V4IWB2_PATFA|nr:hypothetical protein AV530_009157 [Patagioenas fasciata monilis]
MENRIRHNRNKISEIPLNINGRDENLGGCSDFPEYHQSTAVTNLQKTWGGRAAHVFLNTWQLLKITCPHLSSSAFPQPKSARLVFTI